MADARPGGVTLVAVIAWISGAVNIIAGILLLIAAIMAPDALWFGLVQLALGIITIVVSLGLLRGSSRGAHRRHDRLRAGPDLRGGRHLLPAGAGVVRSRVGRSRADRARPAVDPPGERVLPALIGRPARVRLARSSLPMSPVRGYAGRAVAQQHGTLRRRPAGRAARGSRARRRQGRPSSPGRARSGRPTARARRTPLGEQRLHEVDAADDVDAARGVRAARRPRRRHPVPAASCPPSPASSVPREATYFGIAIELPGDPSSVRSGVVRPVGREDVVGLAAEDERVELCDALADCSADDVVDERRLPAAEGEPALGSSSGPPGACATRSRVVNRSM